ncbi:MAG TPA: sodium:solute symporter [Candidatus Hydrogenedentes bacterium]|nr:sodium:solute symporter [Candidatus Hydrogenedentota bacterium]
MTSTYLGPVDYGVIIAYFLVLIGIGIFLKNMASASLADYFIGGRRIPWWALGITGMTSFLDMTGTMIITSFLFLLGPRGIYIEFRGGAVLVLAFCLLWTAKWHRRSQCITGAEWNIFRFGDGPGGRFAQVVNVLANLVSTVGMLAYLMKGAGLFLSMFMPFTPLTCALIMVGVATFYTVMSGFYGVVATDLFQAFLIICVVVIISVMAFIRVGDPAALGSIAEQVTGNGQWMTSIPHWKTTMPPAYEAYESLFMFAFFYFLRNFLWGLGSGQDPKYFGARNDRECGTLNFLWIATMSFRWPMMMGFAVLGVLLVQRLFPDPSAISAATEAIKQFFPTTGEAQWSTMVTQIAYQHIQVPDALIQRLQELLGDDWRRKLLLTSWHGTVNPENILPAVLLYEIPYGLRGLMLSGLLAAAMSTFDSTVNMTSGLMVRDWYQKYLRPAASNRELIAASWGASILQVVLAILMAYSVRSINDIWGWIIMGLGAGLMIPVVLRLYWWRFNGGGYAVGTFAGLAAAVVQRMWWPDLDERFQFIFLGLIGLAGAVLGTLLTPPTDPVVLDRFYRITRPFGFWGPFREKLPPGERAIMDREHFYDIISLPFALTWQITLFILPMQFIIHNFRDFFVTLCINLVGLAGLYFFWYRNLPAENMVYDTGTQSKAPLAGEQKEA